MRVCSSRGSRHTSNAEEWVNIYQTQTVADFVADVVPVAGTVVAGAESFLTATVVGLFGGDSHNLSDAIATTGNQIGDEGAADMNIETNRHHGDAWAMFQDNEDTLSKIIFRSDTSKNYRKKDDNAKDNVERMKKLKKLKNNKVKDKIKANRNEPLKESDKKKASGPGK